MGTIGNQIAAGTQFAVTNDSYNGDGSTTAFTLSQSVSATTDIEVIVDNVQQSPHDSSYSVSGTALTFSGAPATGTNNIYVIYHGSKHHTTAQVIPDDGSVHSSKIANLAVTHAKLHTDMDLSTKNVNPITMSTGTDKMQLAIQSAVSNRFAIRSTHTADYDNNPFIIYQPSGAGHQNDALVITGSGYVTKNKLPSFAAFPTVAAAASEITSYGSRYNNGNHFNTSNGRFTAPVTGTYFFSCFIMTASAGTMDLSLWTNGSDDNHMVPYSSATGGTHNSASGTVVKRLNAGDYVSLRNNTNVGLYIGGNGRHQGFSGFLIG